MIKGVLSYMKAYSVSYCNGYHVDELIIREDVKFGEHVFMCRPNWTMFETGLTYEELKLGHYRVRDGKAYAFDKNTAINKLIEVNKNDIRILNNKINRHKNNIEELEKLKENKQ